MIHESIIISYTYVCGTCGWRSTPAKRRQNAEVEERRHQCGVHREAHDSTGGFRGILGGYNRRCICGAHYVSAAPTLTFACPKDEK